MHDTSDIFAGLNSASIMPKSGWMRSADVRLKFLVVAAGLLVNLASSKPIVPLILCGLALIVFPVNGLGLRSAAKRLIVPSYMAVVVVVTQLLWVGHNPLLELGPLALYREGLASGLLLASRVISGAAIVLAFGAVTPTTEVLALTGWLRLPKILVEVASLMYRYIFLLAEEADRLRQAQVQRLGHSNWRRSMKSYGTLCGAVVVRSYDRGVAVYEAMVARGYSGSIPLYTQESLGMAGWVSALAIVGVSSAVIVLEWIK